MKNSLKKLELNKRTITNLSMTEMNGQIGGVNLGRTKGRTCGLLCGYTARTCPLQCW